MSEFIVNQVDPKEYFHVQTNNKYNPFVTCFPTSVAMPIDYILTILGKTAKDLGIDEEQIEDYLTKMAKKPSLVKWMLNNLGSWTRSYTEKAWLVGKVEEKNFDELMNKLGYDSTFTDDISYENLCKLLYETNIPQVVCGDFSSLRKQYGYKVQGHINCCIGFNNDDGKKDLIVLDPYGYAFQQGYYDPNNPSSGFKVRYPWSLFQRNKNGNGWCLQIRKS